VSPALDLDIGGVEPAASLEPRLRGAVRRTIETGPLDGPPLEQAELSVTLLSADDMRHLNRRFHDVDAPTDVLAFHLGPVRDGAERSLLGDVYVCPDVARGSARELGIDVHDEVVRLVIHGVLHLLGHDHPEGEERYESDMFRLQERLLEEA